MKKLIKCIKALIRNISQQLSSEPPSPVNSRPSVIDLPSVSPQASLVFVCSQCAPELPHKGLTASEELQNWLKSRLKFDGLWGEFRVVSTSCLGVCPQRRVAVVLGSNAGGGKIRCLIIDPQSDRQLLYSRIKQKNG
ncbi:hypothetical protein [Nostoc sp. CCY0012]|uniref:hypothetical protein n=1 Tax=Nostoc sp. CCY0012 TaxID=1056123 RepID=UPI0039C5DC8D